MARFWTTADILSGLQVMLVIVVGAVFCINGRMIAGEYLAFVTYNALLVWPIRMLGRMLSELSKAGVSTERIAYIMDSEEEVIDPDGQTPALDGDLSFDHVSFAYEGSPLMLQDISFTLPGGKTLGILGGTGSGKSTMIALLNKLYLLPDDMGSIRSGGTDIRDIRTDYLRRNIGMVMQEPFLFSRSIRDNIAITAPGMDEAEIRSAARDACLDETVMGFAKGYDTFVGERGVTLSGGQKQRAAIARTLAQKPPILVFDDSLSAVDTETDAKIRAALAGRYTGTTTILISHRITTLQRADLIIVLDKGRITEMGTHEELLRYNGQYRRIYEIQSGLGKEEVYA
jgi:ATP-binding cassette subfamily B protein